MAEMQEMALSLGQSMGRTEEYKALKRAMDAMGDDRELSELKSQLEKLESEIEVLLRSGQQPEDQIKADYEEAIGKLQANGTYQRLVAAQSNFDKIVHRVNETIARGIQEGGESRIILSS
jgi:cell fate (sporulation/competence/biofilm development) regulator YlbF (YheA/YmcA/DUF963 family)